MRKTLFHETLEKAGPSRELIDRTAQLMAAVAGAESPEHSKVRRIHPELPARRRPRLRPALLVCLAIAMAVGAFALRGRVALWRPQDILRPLAPSQTALPGFALDSALAASLGEDFPYGGSMLRLEAEFQESELRATLYQSANEQGAYQRFVLAKLEDGRIALSDTGSEEVPSAPGRGESAVRYALPLTQDAGAEELWLIPVDGADIDNGGLMDILRESPETCVRVQMPSTAFIPTENGEGLELTVDSFRVSDQTMEGSFHISSTRREKIYYIVEADFLPGEGNAYDYSAYSWTCAGSGNWFDPTNYVFVDLGAINNGETLDGSFTLTFRKPLPASPATLRLTLHGYAFTPSPLEGIAGSDLFQSEYSGGVLPTFPDELSIEKTITASEYLDSLERLRDQYPPDNSSRDGMLYLDALTDSGLFEEVWTSRVEMSLEGTVRVEDKGYFLGDRFVTVQSLEITRYGLDMVYDLHTKVPYDPAANPDSAFTHYIPLTPEGEPLYLDEDGYTRSAIRSDKGYVSFLGSAVHRLLDLDAIPEYLVFVPCDSFQKNTALFMDERGLSESAAARAFLREQAAQHPDTCFVVPLTVEAAPELPEGWPTSAAFAGEPTTTLSRDYNAMFRSTLSEPQERGFVRDRWFETSEARVYVDELQADEFGVRGGIHILTRHPYEESQWTHEYLGNFRPFTPDGEFVSGGVTLSAAYQCSETDDGMLQIAVSFNIDHPFQEVPERLIFVPCPRMVYTLVPEAEGLDEERQAEMLKEALWNIYQTEPERCFTVPFGQDHQVHFSLTRSDDSDAPGLTARIESDSGAELFAFFEYSVEYADGSVRSGAEYSLYSSLDPVNTIQLDPFFDENSAPRLVTGTLHVYALTASGLDPLLSPFDADTSGTPALRVVRGAEEHLLSAPEYMDAVRRLREEQESADEAAVLREALTESGLFQEVDTHTLTVHLGA